MRKPAYKTIDLSSYPRRDHFLYFKDMPFPYVALSVNVDITSFSKTLKDNNLPFFLSFLYVVVNSANKVKELRQRIVDGGIIEYDSCLSSHTVLKEDGTFAYCTIDTDMPFKDYIKEAALLNENAKKNGTINDDNGILSAYFVSCLPWVSFTSLIQPVPTPADSNPRITWGKFFKDGRKTLIPVNIQANHSIVDGLHIGEFFSELEKELKSFKA